MFISPRNKLDCIQNDQNQAASGQLQKYFRVGGGFFNDVKNGMSAYIFIGCSVFVYFLSLGFQQRLLGLCICGWGL